MRSICQTCGSPGWEGLLVTCAKCHIACEHCYCMREHSFETSIHFVCAGCSIRPVEKTDCSKRPVEKSFTSDSIKAVPRINRNRVRVESSNPVPKWKKIPETSRMKLISPEEARNLSFKVPKPVPARSAMSLIKQTARVPSSRSLGSEIMARKTNPILLPPNKVEPSPCTLQIRPGVIRQTSKAVPVVEGSKVKVGSGAKYLGSGEICRSIISEKLEQLLPYLPALRPTWKGRIVDSATPSRFSGYFLAQPASKISGKAYTLSKAIPVLLKIELVPIGNVLNDLFVNRSPCLSDVEMYIFQDDKNTKRFMDEHANLFEAMGTRNAMIRIYIKDTPFLIFSSKLLDQSSQNIVKTQKNTNNFLWGIFLLTKKSLALVPGTSNQTAQHSNGLQLGHNNHRNSGKQLQRHDREKDWSM